MYKHFKRDSQVIGKSAARIYYLFQRVFRVNAHVPWPVHWSSVVKNPERITRKCPDKAPFPGYMPGCYIQAVNGIHIGANVRMGPGLKIVSANHDVYDYAHHEKSGPIVIEDNCWLAANAVILPGVHLGEHTVVAAGSVVTKSFPAGNQVLAGVPAAVIKKLEDYGRAEEGAHGDKA